MKILYLMYYKFDVTIDKKIIINITIAKKMDNTVFVYDTVFDYDYATLVDYADVFD